MKPTKNTQKALSTLLKWQQKQMLYSPFLHEIDAFYEFEEYEYLDDWFNFDFEETYKDRFLSFASDPTGGQYCLWYYPDLVGEPPVVFLGSEGETNILTSNLEDFVLLFTAGQILGAGEGEPATPKDLWRKIYSFELEDFANDLGLSPEKAKEKLSKSIAKFKEFVHSKITEKPLETIFSDLENQPDFVAWVKTIRDKHQDEILFIEEDPLSLDLSYEDLTEIPISVLDDLAIETLDLSNNEITKISDFITRLMSLKSIDLSNNGIIKIPDFVAKLKNLKSINLSNNQITDIPLFFEDFQQLESLSLQYNNIKELKLDFTKMKSLERLDIYENPNFEFIDPSIFKAKSLVSIDYEDTLLEKSLSEFSFIEQSSSEFILEDITYIASDLVDEDKANIPRIEAIFEKRINLYPSFDAYYSYGFFIQYSRGTNYEQAKDLYLKAIATNDPEMEPVVYTHLAKIYYYHLEKDFDLAEKYYRKAIELDKENTFSYDMYISFLVHHKNDYRKASKLYKKLIKIDPKDTSYLIDYAEFLKYKLEKPKKALKIYKRLLRINPTKKRYLKYYAETIAFDLAKPKKALKIFKKLLKNKKSADNYYNYITALQDTKATPELIKALFVKGKKKHPEDEFLNDNYYAYLLEIGEEEQVAELIKNGQANEEVFAQYGYHLLAKENNEKCKVILEIGIGEFPNSEKLLGLQLNILTALKEKDNSKIIGIAQKLLKLTEDEQLIKKLQLIIASKETLDKNTSKFDAFIASKNGDVKELVKSVAIAFSEKAFEKALAILQTIEKIDPYQSDMLSMYFSLLKMNKGEATAVDFLKKKLASDKPNINVLIELIKVNIKYENDDETIKYSEIAKEHYPEDERVIRLLEFVRSLKITATSAEEFEALLKDNPNDTMYLQAYADFLLENEEYKKAIKVYEKIIEIDKEIILAYINMSVAYSVLDNPKKEAFYLDKAIMVNPIKTLTILMSLSLENFKKYMDIAVEKFPDNTELQELVATVKNIV